METLDSLKVDNTRLIILFDYNKTKFVNNKWYSQLVDQYRNILWMNNFMFKVVNVFNRKGKIDKNKLLDVYRNNMNNLYLFTPIDFALLLISITYCLNEIIEFISKISYVILWQEIMNTDLSIIGYNINDDQKYFIKHFFSSAKLTICSNMVSIESLAHHKIFNTIYYIISGYSEINKCIPLHRKPTDIDILIYGTIHKSYIYRTNIINNVISYFKNLRIEIKNDIFRDELDDYLSRTKIVLHVPSHSNLSHMPWPKISSLQAKKVFFIIENNKELHDRQLNSIMVYYYDIHHLFSLIETYLDDSKRQEYVEKNYKFIIENSNMDIFIPKIFNTIYHDQI